MSGRRITGLLTVLAGLTAAVVLALLTAGPVKAAPSESRQAYVATLDPICKVDAQRNSKLLRGTEKMVRNNKTKQPARKFARVARNFERTLKRISAVEPAAGDEATVARWIRQLRVQARLLNQMSKVLKQGKRGKAQGLKLKLLRNSNKANNTVFLFDFKHCVINPMMYG